MTILLAGDIGGTKTILRLVQAEIAANTPLPALATLYEHTYASREFLDLVPMVRSFVATATAALGTVPTPERACFGIAGPVINNTSTLTNLGWMLEADDLQRDLNIPMVSLINDFASVGYGVLGLSAADLHPLRTGQPEPMGAIAVIGAGTGLGQGYVVPYPGGHCVFATEGGHADFAPRSEIDTQLVRFLKDHHSIDRVSVERVVSGMGIESIYQFMRRYSDTNESPAMAQAFQTWMQERGKEEKTVDLPALISQQASAKSDYLCMETMDIFIRAYGAETGNLALKLLPHGGIYIAGGIAAKNLELLARGSFLEAFGDKGRVSSAIAHIPIYVVLNPRVGLIGSAVCAAQIVKGTG